MPSRLIEVPLGVEVVFPGGRTRRHGYAELPNRALARQLAEIHLALTNTGGGVKSPATSSGYATAIKHVAAFLHDYGHTGTLETLDEDAFRALMHALPSRRHEQIVKTLLLTLEDMNPGAVAEAILTHCHVQGAWTEAAGYDPLEPFTPGEALRVEQACKTAIAASEQRLARGAELAARGADPAGAWKSLENLLWLIARRGPLALGELAGHCGVSPSHLQGWLAKTHELTVTELHGLLYPTLDDLTGYLLLLGLKTGISPEGIAALKLSALVAAGEGRVRVQWVKPRGGGLEADTFSAKGQWSPGKLLDRVRTLTAPAREHAPNGDRDEMWLFMAYGAAGTGVRAARSRWNHSVGRFVAAHELLNDNGQPLNLDRRRLRKTFYARLDRRYHGAVNVIAGANQTPQVAADHYLATSGETDLLRQVIEDTQRGLLARAEQARQVTVISEAELPALQADPQQAAARLGVAVDKAKTLLGGEAEDVFAAKCKDFHHSPHGRPGEPCQAAVWECLFCPLAVITPTKLPKLLALLDHIDGAYERMTTVEWQRRYAAARRAITEQILPRFSDEVIAAARAKASAEQLYLRPEELAS